ncbi:MAG: phosphoribosylglycinamide formyltransferase [Zoogloeaceae bacterium]|jgi:phosphoribosylglycinamide formyltransferase-1|nr:phosphoribosylglycinamide formyltransferase [Zoogloeaceae bacterium]
MKKIVILISGRGSNMACLIRAWRSGLLGAADIAAVLADRNAPGLDFAAAEGICARIIDASACAGNSALFDARLTDAMEEYAPDLIVFAGFMRILGEAFTRRYAGKMLNIHPSLLPSFPGLHTHRRALEAGVRLHGATVHFVTADLDAGPIVAQAAVPVLDEDDEASLAARVLAAEHQIFPAAVRWFVEGRLRLEGGRARLRGKATTADALCAPRLLPDTSAD